MVSFSWCVTSLLESPAFQFEEGMPVTPRLLQIGLWQSHHSNERSGRIRQQMYRKYRSERNQSEMKTSSESQTPGRLAVAPISKRPPTLLVYPPSLPEWRAGQRCALCSPIPYKIICASLEGNRRVPFQSEIRFKERLCR